MENEAEVSKSKNRHLLQSIIYLQKTNYNVQNMTDPHHSHLVSLGTNSLCTEGIRQG